MAASSTSSSDKEPYHGPLNTRTAAVIDPILSTHARGYRNSEFVGHLLFPRVTIPNRSMHVLKFGKEDFRMVSTRRAPGADKKRINVGYAADVVSLVQDALEGKVPSELLEEAAKVPGVNLGQNPRFSSGLGATSKAR